jgi:methionyl aminopeptidase
VYHGGYHGDLNATYTVGKVDAESQRLVDAAHGALYAAIHEVKPGTMYREIGNIITNFINPTGFSVVRTYCGHGISRLFHCAPNIPHYASTCPIDIC